MLSQDSFEARQPPPPWLSFSVWMGIVTLGFIYVAGVLCGRESLLQSGNRQTLDFSMVLVICACLYGLGPRFNWPPVNRSWGGIVRWNGIAYVLPFFAAFALGIIDPFSRSSIFAESIRPQQAGTRFGLDFGSRGFDIRQFARRKYSLGMASQATANLLRLAPGSSLSGGMGRLATGRWGLFTRASLLLGNLHASVTAVSKSHLVDCSGCFFGPACGGHQSLGNGSALVRLTIPNLAWKRLG